ncbi:hypothetical protein [Desulfoglaeba alkanexedens]|nr:hypothetical protein [Desulfoglaeba alkanexedens]
MTVLDGRYILALDGTGYFRRKRSFPTPAFEKPLAPARPRIPCK